MSTSVREDSLPSIVRRPGGPSVDQVPGHGGTPGYGLVPGFGPVPGSGQLTPAAEPEGVTVGIEVDRCVGCLACATACKFDVLHLMPGVWAVEADADRCTACRRCVGSCPFGAITVTGEPRNRRRLIVDHLRASLRSTCPGGWSVMSGGPAFRPPSGGASLTPDLAVVRAPAAGLEWLSGEDAPVPLVVDVLSSSTKREDLEPRRELFWNSGVTTYWTVDQRSGEVRVQWSARPGWFDPWAKFSFS